MFWPLVQLLCFLSSGCLRKEPDFSRAIIGADTIEIRGNLTDPFNVDVFSRVEHFFETRLNYDTLRIIILNSEYCYQERKLIKLDLCIYQMGKATGFRITFSNLRDNGDLVELISNWIKSFLVEKFGVRNESTSNAIEANQKLNQEKTVKANFFRKGKTVKPDENLIQKSTNTAQLESGIELKNSEELPAEDNSSYLNLMLK